MSRNYRGLSSERKIRVVYWWCYMHSPELLPLSEIIKVMLTDRVSQLFIRMNRNINWKIIF